MMTADDDDDKDDRKYLQGRLKIMNATMMTVPAADGADDDRP